VTQIEPSPEARKNGVVRGSRRWDVTLPVAGLARSTEVHGYSTGTAQAVLDHAPPGARLVFSCGWHITRDGQDVYSWKLKAIVKVFGPLARLARFADLDDQVGACRRVFASDTRWTVVQREAADARAHKERQEARDRRACPEAQ